MKSLMRAIFNCSIDQLITMVENYETATASKLELAIHGDSDKGEAMVSGEHHAVMTLIGVVASRGLATLNEAWTYEC